MRLFMCEARRRKRSIVSLCEHFGDRSFVQKELIRTIFLKDGTTNGEKRRVGVCKQKITERCVNISKIKIVTFFRPLLLPYFRAKRVPKKWRVGGELRIRSIRNKKPRRCEHLGYRSLTQKFALQFPHKKTHREMKFKANKMPDAQHTKRM